MHEKRKKREYLERIRNVEHGDFTPLVVATTEGLGAGGSMTLKRLAWKLAEKKGDAHILSRWLAPMPPLIRNPTLSAGLSSRISPLQTKER